ncbi:MAG: hypothetical protein MI674_02165 [Cytophagales bacterium]|nr:hypothetical protein [Cytophagales bacterium]
MLSNIAQGRPRKIIVMLPGLGHYDGDGFRTLAARLKEYHRGVEIIDIVVETFDLTIDEQARDVFLKLKQRGVEQEDKIVLIGHSQGGLRAYALLRQYGKLLTIRGLVSIGVPWKGAPVINNHAKVVNILHTPAVRDRIDSLNEALENCHNLKGVLAKKCFTNYQASHSLHHMIEEGLNDYFNDDLASPGAKDMKPGSDFLQDLGTTSETFEGVLTSAIIGGQNDIFAGVASGVNLVLSFTKAINMGLYCCSFDRSVNRLRLALREIQHAIDRNRGLINQKAAEVLGSNKHDGLVPEYSQCIPEEVLKGADCFGQHRIPDAYHDEFFKSRRERHFRFFNRNSDFIAYKHPQTTEIIKAFVTEAFNNNST